MPDYTTVSDLLAAQTERKLNRMRESIQAEVARLNGELKLVDAALFSKRTKPVQVVAGATGATGGTTVKNAGRFEGLPREELLNHVALVGRPVTAPEMRDILEVKGIVRRTEAVRTGLSRLYKRGDLIRTSDGKFAVPSVGNGHRTEDGPGLSRQASLSDGYPPGASDG